VLLTGCALRPRYGEVVAAQTPGSEVKLTLVNSANNQPLPNVRVEIGEGKARYQATSDAKGLLTLPNKKSYRDENSLIVVTLPPRVDGYRLGLAPVEAAPAEPAVAPVPDGAAKPEGAADGGADDGVTRL
jgi:hypothetical protein